MIVALTGTPGTGKSTVSKLLRTAGYRVLDLNEIILDNNLVTGYDSSRNSAEVDLEKLDKYLSSSLKTNPNRSSEPTFLEGHLAHLVNKVNLVIVLRCHPTELQRRLNVKKWSAEKVRENLEAEAVDAITIEAVDRIGMDKIFEIDTTNDKPKKLMGKILDIINGNVSGYSVGQIDWSEEILKWY